MADVLFAFTHASLFFLLRHTPAFINLPRFKINDDTACLEWVL
jgi:hypothetical protein